MAMGLAILKKSDGAWTRLVTAPFQRGLSQLYRFVVKRKVCCRLFRPREVADDVPGSIGVDLDSKKFTRQIQWT